LLDPPKQRIDLAARARIVFQRTIAHWLLSQVRIALRNMARLPRVPVMVS
jgi:hypothetical protein